MSAIGEVIAGAGGALVSQLWKVAALVASGLVLVVGVGAGTGWYMASAARDEALRDLRAEQGVSAELRAGIKTQNTAIIQWYDQAKQAQARGDAAMAVAQTNGRRYDAALQELASGKATSCEEAMPYVNQLLEKVR